MPASRIKISYSAPVNFLASDQWIQIRTALDERLPLRNLHWKAATDDPVRTIQELEVDFISLDSMKDEGSSQVPASLLERPFMNLFIFACEDSETYRTTFKKQVKDWQTSISSKRHQEWLVILVVRPDTKTTGASRIFSMKAPVLDRVKADINVDKKRDRCVELPWPVTQDDTSAWTELVAKLKEGIIFSFDSYVTMRQEDIQKSESQRTMPGWNFCTYFILKESLAMSFEGMGLMEESLQQYMELERSFFQALEEKNLPWFGNLGGTTPGDDSRPLFDLTHKPYRDLILNNTITLFDFRIYLFACQMVLLTKQHLLLQVLSKSLAFIVSFSRTLRENERSFTPFFIESWIFSACLNLIKDMNLALNNHPSYKEDVIFIQQYRAKEGELTELARKQLDKIGMSLDFLSNSPPFSLSWHNPSAIPKLPLSNRDSITSKISRKELAAALGDKEAFDSLYVSITQKAIELYAEGKRRKFALKLHGDLAAFDESRGRDSTAHQTYASLPAHYSSSKHKWPPMEAFMLARALDSHTRSNEKKDKAWLEQAVTFVGLCAQSDDDASVESGGVTDGLLSIALQQKDDTSARQKRETYLSQLVVEIRNIADALGEGIDILRLNYPAFSINLATQDACLSKDQDGSHVDIILNNFLPCDVIFDVISLEVLDYEEETFQYKSTQVQCQPGRKTVSLFCPNSSSGIYRIQSVSAWISKLHFEWPLSSQDNSPPSQPPTVTPATTPATTQSLSLLHGKDVIRIPFDSDAVNVKLSMPRTIHWDAEPTVMLELDTGRNNIKETTIKVTGPTGIKFRMQDSEVLSDSMEENSTAAIAVEDGNVVCKDLVKGQVISLSIPHSPAPAGGMLVAAIHVTYQVEDSSPSQTLRHLKVLKKINSTLPIQISVMDSFRGKTLLSKFTISSTSHLQVRIKETRLEGGTDLNIKHPRRTFRNGVMVTPQRVSHFLYQIQSDKPRYERETLKLEVVYRTIRDEIEKRLERECSKTFDGQTEHISEAKLLLIEALAANTDWLHLYMNTAELHLSLPEGADLREEMKSGLESTIERLKIAPTKEELHTEDESNWQKLVIPVDLPFLHILCAIQMHVQGDQESIYAGQPLSIRLEIGTSFHWGSVGDPAKTEYNMRYIVQESVTDWLVSGHKRADFIARDEATYAVELTLVPLHHGELSLPTIAVIPLSAGNAPEMQGLPSTETYHVHAAQRVMILPRGGRSTFVVGMSGDM